MDEKGLSQELASAEGSVSAGQVLGCEITEKLLYLQKKKKKITPG